MSGGSQPAFREEGLKKLWGWETGQVVGKELGLFEDSSWEWTNDGSPREKDRDPTARMFSESELLPEEPTVQQSNLLTF